MQSVSWVMVLNGRRIHSFQGDLQDEGPKIWAAARKLERKTFFFLGPKPSRSRRGNLAGQLREPGGSMPDVAAEALPELRSKPIPKKRAGGGPTTETAARTLYNTPFEEVSRMRSFEKRVPSPVEGDKAAGSGAPKLALTLAEKTAKCQAIKVTLAKLSLILTQIAYLS